MGADGGTSGIRESVMEQKLDMSLDELVSKDGRRNREASRSPYRERRDSRGRDFGRDREYGKGKGKRRYAPEDKALMNTHCFFNTEGVLVVRLYDTEVFVLKERPIAPSDVKPPASDDKEIVEEKKAASDQKAAGEENTVAPSDEKLVVEETPKPPQEEAAPSNAEIESVIVNQSENATIEKSKQNVASATVANSESMGIDGEKPTTTAQPENGAVSETQPSTSEAVVDDTKPSTPPGVDVKPVESQEDAKALDAKPLATSESPAVAKEDAGGSVLILNSGRFKTVETKYIINEAAKPLSVRIISSEAQPWTVSGDGLAGRSRDFEDKMEIPLKSEMARASAVKKHMDDKISEAKDRERRGGRRGDYDSHRDFAQPPSHGWRPGMPPPVQWPHGPPPPGWHGSLPGAWGTPPTHHVPPGHHWDPHRPPIYGVHPGAPAGPPAKPRGPLPDSMFQ